MANERYTWVVNDSLGDEFVVVAKDVKKAVDEWRTANNHANTVQPLSINRLLSPVFVANEP